MLNTQNMGQKYNQLVAILREMFQMDNADLDFGIYRIMNKKREQIDRFLEQDFWKIIIETIGDVDKENLSKLQSDLDNLITGEKERGYDEDAINRLQKVKDLRAKIEQAKITELAIDAVFEHLAQFFKTYYDTGDFITQRRYKKDKYAIPYEGQEVKLHWVNHDQYYIKTTQYFTNYAFTIAGGKTVVFQVRGASTERDNNKAQNGKQRVFMLDEKESYRVDGDTLYIYFNYVLVEKKSKATNDDENEDSSDSSPVQNGNGNRQKAINQHIVKLITQSLDQDDLKPFRGLASPVDEKSDRTLLEKNLTQYTARNEFDYFIHKDLRKFLERELEFYIKTEMLHIDEFDTDQEKPIMDNLLMIRAFKRIAKKLIAFLSQIENFQKKMWLKKKIVVSSEYCMTLHHVDNRHYLAILANTAQLAEWVKLGFIDNTSQVTEDFLNNHQSLVLDTAFFPDLRDELIADIDNLDDKVGGVLINSENFQTLNLLQERYGEQVRCVYIDPPYNSATSKILYKNSFEHSSWLSMIYDRIEKSKSFMSRNGMFVIAIDENENDYLSLILDILFPEYNRTAVSVVHNPRGIQGDAFSYTHEYSHFIFPIGMKLSKKKIANKQKPLMKTGSESERHTAKNCFYPIYISREGELIGFGDVPPDDYHPESSQVELEDGTLALYPISTDGRERKWRYTKKSLAPITDKLVITKTRMGKWNVDLLKDAESFRTVWSNTEYNAAEHGSTLLKNIVPEVEFSFPKSIFTVRDSILVGDDSKNNIILDYFAGSGTTGHAVINLNRDDDGERKYILVEMGTYFDTVLKPRIQKVIYSANWKGGKPQDTDSGISHIFKYMRLESYEDTMNNLVVSPVQATLFDGDKNPIAKLRETYLLSYMLDMETRDSRSLLGYGVLNNPFNVEMNIISNDNQQIPQIVNLVETFNYLLGLHVDKMLTETNGMKIVTGKLPRSQETVLVVWRVVGTHSDEELKTVLNNHNASDYDKVYVNRDNSAELPQMRLIEEIFAERMFAEDDVNAN